MEIPRYKRASIEDIERLKRLVKKVVDKPIDKVDSNATIADEEHKQEGAPVISNNNVKEVVIKSLKKPNKIDLFDGSIQHVKITREALQFDNPLSWLLFLKPDFKPYKWQIETLMLMAGYLTPGRYTEKDKSEINEKNPLLFVGSMANGSGKDMVLFAATVTWFVIKGARNRAIVTSASYEQLKSQTEIHIKELINIANEKIPGLFSSKEFHHLVPELGSEIKLFRTDEPGRAEGYHPFDGGEMLLGINEAKSYGEALFQASTRCTGYSIRLEISSPGDRSGFMYRHAGEAIKYPEPAQLNKYYFRQVSAYECPHISQSHIERMAKDHGMDSSIFKSSVLAEFSDFESNNIITEESFDQCVKYPPKPAGKDIGIGLDLAGGGDETALYVRLGNRIIHSYFFKHKNTQVSADIINLQLSPWKDADYEFRADNGGMGIGIIDRLILLGWKVTRCNNQSPAHNKSLFLNRGAEMYYKIKRLIERKLISVTGPTGKELSGLRVQLTTREYKGENSDQGKIALQSKIDARLAGKPSPDRADGYVLCFSSFSSEGASEDQNTSIVGVSNAELLVLAQNPAFWNQNRTNKRNSHTLLTANY